MATYSSILAWRIPWTEDPGGLRFRGSQKVGRNVTSEHTCLFLYAAHLSVGDLWKCFSCYTPWPFHYYVFEKISPGRG